MISISKKQLVSAGMAMGAALTLALGAGALTFAAGTTTPAGGTTQGKPGVAGTVSAVSGNTVTITGKDGSTYTIDASGATITKDETVGVSDIAVGDTIAAQGTVSGTSVSATQIHDGNPPAGGARGGFGMRGPGKMGVRGTVSALNGNTLTVSATNPQTNTTTTYTVDASNAQVMLGSATQGTKPTTGSVSSIKTGDTVMIAGQVSGTSITAKMIFDGPMPQMGHGPWGGKPGAPADSTTTTQ